MSAEKTPAETRRGVENQVSFKHQSEFASLKINGERLWSRLSELGEIGSYMDERTAMQGVRRLALTDSEIEGRNLVVKWMLDQNLTVTIDPIGNVYARRKGRDETLAPVMMGSHIDSVGTAGRFDGCLGVIGGLEVLATLDDNNVTTDRPLVVAFFTDEEGVRFGTDMLGSATAVGRLPLEDALSLKDRDGVSVADELARHNQRGDAPWLFEEKPHAYVECHIEQGPVLLTENYQLGVVTGVQGISWWRIKIGGAAAHAGCTPMSSRRDSGLALSLMRTEMHKLTERIPGLLCNFGLLSTTPGLTNVIPDTASGTIDLRHPDEVQLQEAERQMREIIAESLDAASCELIELVQTARTAPVLFHEDIVNAVESEIGRNGVATRRIVSGAGHDAQELASIVPSGMVFVRGQNDGVSHSPRELSTLEDCQAGVQVTLQVVCGLSVA
jgi:N-carbamoyl-L-amino-acid hydrolase